jgi:hypothetical protein
MARKAILETGYTFTPSTNTIIIPRVIPRERLILITNVTTNTVIYNFSDSNLKANTYTVSTTGGTNTTTVVLNYNTSGMTSTDKLQIIVDEYDEKFSPSETYTDPINKFRVSEPQALIDTDFEYGTQISKWENLAMINNRPFSFPSAIGVGTINFIQFPNASRTVTVGLQNAAPGLGTAITVQDTFLNIANGNFVIETVSGAGSTIFTYTARATNTTSVTNVLDPNKTGIFSGTVYANAGIGTLPIFASNTVGTAITVTTTVPHGLAIGNEVSIVGTSRTEANGSFVVATINSAAQFVYYSIFPPQANPTGGIIYVRPQGQFLHRPFDGGIIFTSNANANFETATRQTRRYFRYQSGKGIQISSGTCLKPNLQIDSLTSTGVSIGSTIRVQTKEQHNIQGTSTPGTVVTISGANETGYNGSYTVNSVTGYNSFNVTSTSGIGSTIASGNYNCSVASWYGCVNRLGAFDAQNGVLFEFDGQTLSAVRRSSTFQLSGKVTVTSGINTITQTEASFPTAFSKQLSIGDFIVLRGQSYRVIDIASDTSMTISPSYRGATAQYVIISKTQDLKIPQSQWNIDKCDGTGPSGYNIDLTKMQMFYIDYSWYGAGFIRWGFRGPDGNVIYCHKMINNNVNTEAYMRSGNLPGRYESESRPPTTQITTNLGASDTVVGVASTAGFPPAGTLCIRNLNTYEYVNYAGIGTTAFTGLTRARSGATGLSLTNAPIGSNVATATTTNLQVGQRVIGGFPEGTYISAIGVGNITLSQAATAANPTGVIVPPMGATSGQTFTFSPTDPVAVELAFPTYGPSISHWGTSVIMDGRFDDDKSLVFTYGQITGTNLTPGQTKALMSIRVAPSVDGGVAAAFGQRELVNRVQLVLRNLGVSIAGITTANVLVRAFLNGTPSSATTWTNAVGNVAGQVNSSLAQIADYGGGNVTVIGGEVTAGFFVNSTSTLDLGTVRDLGNSILGGGGVTANTQIYPDGPDVLTITATNLTPGTSVNLLTRLSWTEAQA